MPWNDHVDAAVAVFLAGEATGLGIADVLFGKVNPGAKSPATRTDVIVTYCDFGSFVLCFTRLSLVRL